VDVESEQNDEEIDERNDDEIDEENDDENEEEMSVDAALQPAAIEQALGAANALGKLSIKKGGGSNDIADGLDELNMDDYDDEDDGILLIPLLLFSSF
ncbi:hypothetical protein Tco_1527009, partial [Tanacetum coccineum]